jgi:hypothetical protein
MSALVCTCLDHLPLVNKGDDDALWWVHAICGKPIEAWLRARGDQMLLFFRGGPMDGYAYAMSTVLEHPELVEGYRWIPKMIVSKKNDDTARVWLHESLPDDAEIVLDHERHDLVTIEQEDRAMPTMEKRRRDLKLSRERLGELAGLTPAQVQRIESNGVRTTDEERRSINDVLDRLEAARQPANPQ